MEIIREEGIQIKTKIKAKKVLKFMIIAVG